MAAHRLVRAGWRVLMLERGPWVPRGPESRDPAATVLFSPFYTKDGAARRMPAGDSPEGGAIYCVGGPSVFYGGTSFRFREEDFAPGRDIVGLSGAAWPFRYDALERYYGEAERLLGVSGDDEGDPTRPPRSEPFPFKPPPLAEVSGRFRDSALKLGLHPFPLPLAINFAGAHGRNACDACRQCDTYACSIEAKNDLAVAVIAPLMSRGLEVRADTVVRELVTDGRRVTEVRAWDRTSGETVIFRARHVIVAAGALASPHLLLASGLQRVNPAGAAVGAYLTRHCSAMIFGFCNDRPDRAKVFHKQLAVLDYYRGDPDSPQYAGVRLGSIQQITTPPTVLVKTGAPSFFKNIPLHGFVEHLTSALVIAEDQPRAGNRVSIDWERRDEAGLPGLDVTSKYTETDVERRRGLVRRTKRILRGVGAWSFYTHDIETFSHALGTVRMGTDPSAAPLDEWCRYRGLDNLRVVDGSALPTAGAVNPSRTIAAVALRATDQLVSEELA